MERCYFYRMSVFLKVKVSNNSCL